MPVSSVLGAPVVPQGHPLSLVSTIKEGTRVLASLVAVLLHRDDGMQLCFVVEWRLSQTTQIRAYSSPVTIEIPLTSVEVGVPHMRLLVGGAVNFCQ